MDDDATRRLARLEEFVIKWVDWQQSDGDDTDDLYAVAKQIVAVRGVSASETVPKAPAADPAPKPTAVTTPALTPGAAFLHARTLMAAADELDILRSDGHATNVRDVAAELRRMGNAGAETVVLPREAAAEARRVISELRHKMRAAPRYDVSDAEELAAISDLLAKALKE